MARPKRERSFHLQAFYDPKDPNDAPIIDLVRRAKANGWSQKQLLTESLRCYAESHGIELPPAVDQTDVVQAVGGMFAELSAKLDALKHAIASGTPIQSASVANVVQDISNGMDAIQSSIGNNFHPVSYDEDEDV